jgi:hypothetical protein
MSKVQLQGNALGTGIFTIASPNSNTDRTINLPDAAGTLQVSGNPISGTTGTFSGLIYANGGGVQFPATQVASGDANCLDDYEEGTWSPIWTSTGATWSYATQYGQYIKVGRFVKAQFYLYATASGTTSNAVLVSNLPFTSANLSAFSQDAAPVWFSGAQVLQPLVNNNATTISVWRSQFILLATAADVSGQYFVGTAVYYAAS